MVLIQPLQEILIIPKSIEVLLFLIVSIFIAKQFRNAPRQERPLLNRLFLAGIIGWTVYITLDIFIYVFAGWSFDALSPLGTYSGYNLEYLSLLIVQILRDIGMAGAMIITVSYFLAAFTIQMGEIKTRRYFFNIPSFVGISVISLVIIYYDQIAVTISASGISVSAIWNSWSGLSLFIIILLYIMSAIILSLALREANISENSKETKRKIRFLIAGVLFMALGHFYWFILGQLVIYAPLFIGMFNVIALYVFGHMLWATSPICIYVGLSYKKKQKNQTSEPHLGHRTLPSGNGAPQI